jgi:hypothetical protein
MSNDIKQATKTSDTEARTRDEYTSPALKEFGSVGALTQSGSGGANEASGMMA